MSSLLAWIFNNDGDLEPLGMRQDKRRKLASASISPQLWEHAYVTLASANSPTPTSKSMTTIRSVMKVLLPCPRNWTFPLQDLRDKVVINESGPVHSSIFFHHLFCTQGHRGIGVYPSCLRGRGGVCPGLLIADLVRSKSKTSLRVFFLLMVFHKKNT